ncbi:MAG: sulfur oxidation c-type cytochrome SoxA [Woeseiaceae bacterium]|nr:sulfur oxidation c-type cytochrome SoxA [Woeseiaceae bacterium]
MKKAATALGSILAILLVQQAALAGPEEDRAAFAAYYQSRFPEIPFAEFANGIYAIDSDARSQWLEIEEFPPYEFAIEVGEAIWSETLPDGSSLGNCFEQPVEDIRTLFPRFDASRGEVVTLEVAINDCRSAHDLPPLGYDSQAMVSTTAYLAFEARGRILETRIPDDQLGALAAYEAGKQFYYSKRGQLNFACADCHITSVGQYVRADRLSASLGHATHFPVYRSKLGTMISLQQRFAGCMRDVRAKPFELQSVEYRNLEYFLNYMSNGLELNGPGARK